MDLADKQSAEAVNLKFKARRAKFKAKRAALGCKIRPHANIYYGQVNVLRRHELGIYNGLDAEFLAQLGVKF